MTSSAHKKTSNSARIVSQAFKTHQQQLSGPSISLVRSYLPPVWHELFIIITILIFLSKPAMSLPEQASALISSPNVSTVDGGVHGHRAFVFLSPYIPMVDRGALPRLTLASRSQAFSSPEKAWLREARLTRGRRHLRVLHV